MYVAKDMHERSELTDIRSPGIRLCISFSTLGTLLVAIVAARVRDHYFHKYYYSDYDTAIPIFNFASYARRLPNVLSRALFHSFYSEPDDERLQCRPFLPDLFELDPPSASEPWIRIGLEEFDRYLEKRWSDGDLDALSIAIVTSAGSVYERNLGVLRANASRTPGVETSPLTNASSYRIADVSQLFTILEGMVLERAGALRW